jgi:hypothetical protein
MQRHWAFRNTVLGAVLISAYFLATEYVAHVRLIASDCPLRYSDNVINGFRRRYPEPFPPDPVRHDLYYAVDWVLNIFFTFEMVIKVVGLGRVYLAEKWNILDGTIVVSSWAALIVEVVMGGQFAGAVTNLRILRVLRPLRVLESIPGLRIIINSTLYAVRDVGVLLAIGLPSDCL